MASAKDQPPAVPSQAGFEEMRRHLAEEHGMEFEAERDVFYAGNPSPEAVLIHHPETPGCAEAFWCAHCPGLLAIDPPLPKARARVPRSEAEVAVLLDGYLSEAS